MATRCVTHRVVSSRELRYGPPGLTSPPWIYVAPDPKATVTTASPATVECDTVFGQAGEQSGKSRLTHLTWLETNVGLG